MATTTIQVNEVTAERLHARKRRGDSYDDVIVRLLDGDPDEATADVPESVDDLDVPGSGATAERRRRTIGRLYAYLRDQGTAEKSDFLALVDPDDVGYASEASFWSNCVKGKDTLSALPGVETPGEGERRWRFVGAGGGG